MIPPTTSPYLIVKRSRIHNVGVFARRDIPAGTRIIEYVGEKITKAESDRRGPALVDRNKNSKEKGSVYIFTLNKRYDIDGNVPYNTAKYINHSCDPNCETDIIRGKIWIIAIRDIKKGEEITYNYGYDLEDFENHRCYCNTDRCVGYIAAEEHWPKLRRILSRRESKTRRSRRYTLN